MQNNGRINFITPVFQILQLMAAISSINRDVLTAPDIKF